MPKETKKFINPLLRPSSDAEPMQEVPARDTSTSTSAATFPSTQTSANEPLSQPMTPLAQAAGPMVSPAQPVSPAASLTTPSGVPASYPQQGYAPASLQPIEPAPGMHNPYGYAGREADQLPISSMDAQPNTYTQTQAQTYMPAQPQIPAYQQQHPQSSNPTVREAAYPYYVPDRPTSDNFPIPQPTTNMPPATYTNVPTQANAPYPVLPPSPSPSPLPQTYTPANTYTSPAMVPSPSPPSGNEVAELPAYYSTTAVPRRRRGAQSFEQTHERITLWIDKRLKQAFDELSYEHDLSKTSLLNEAVADLLRKYASR